jgi:hypothetical protein
MADQDRLDIETFRKGKAAFDEAHRKGMDALRRHDYVELGEAIKIERDIVEEQQDALKKARGAHRPR